jgi:hypothetical protein
MHNDIKIQRFMAKYFLWKYPDSGLWISILKRKFEGIEK